jgi:N-hydroxyarylamine O-acetyltransferase
MVDMAHQLAPAAPTTEWHTELFDVDAYLNRVGLPWVPPTAESLRALHRAHVLAIPFENVDVLLGTHRGLAPEAIVDKLVRRRRGGYCFEHALLFAAVAERMGFEVRRLMARVHPAQVHPDGSGSPTHMALRVHADGVAHLVDVGFGPSMIAPMSLRDGVLVDQAGWLHRLTEDRGYWTLEKRTGDCWERLYAFDESPRRPIDYEMAHRYTSTHPASPFTSRLMVMRVADRIRRRLVDDQLTVERADGRVQRTSVPPERLDDTLTQLGVVLKRGELAELRARLAGRPELWAD